MTIRGDPLEQIEGLNAPVAVSISAHAMLLTGISLWSAFNAPIQLGQAGTLAAGAVSVKVVQGVPLSAARSRIPNPVANPAEHSVPAVPSESTSTPAQAPEDDPSAVEVESKRRKRPPKPARKASRSKPPAPANQLSSSTGAAASLQQSPREFNRRRGIIRRQIEQNAHLGFVRSEEIDVLQCLR